MSARLPSIQILRGVAATLVVLVHAINMIVAGEAPTSAALLPASLRVREFGACGVDLFFVISGFVMAHTLATGTPSVWRFLLARWWRIFPPFALASLAFLLVAPTPAPRAIWMSVTILPLDLRPDYVLPFLWVGWSLAFEFAFYIMVAAVIPHGPRRIAALLYVTLLCGALGILITPQTALWRIVANPIHFEFALGVLVWLAWRHDALGDRGLLRWAPLAGALLLALTMLPLGSRVSLQWQDLVAGRNGVARTLAFGIPWALIVAGTLRWRTDGRFGRVAGAIGDASYATYLTHPIVIGALALIAPRLPDTGIILWLAIVCVLATVAGLIAHRLVEQPLLRIARPLRAIGARLAADLSRRVRPARSIPSH